MGGSPGAAPAQLPPPHLPPTAKSSSLPHMLSAASASSCYSVCPGSSTICFSLGRLFLSCLLEEAFPPGPGPHTPGLSPFLCSPAHSPPALFACLTPTPGAHLSLCVPDASPREDMQCHFQNARTTAPLCFLDLGYQSCETTHGSCITSVQLHTHWALVEFEMKGMASKLPFPPSGLRMFLSVSETESVG